MLSHTKNGLHVLARAIMEKFQIGDLVFYQGRSFVSRVIETWTRSKVSHVGIIYAWWKQEPVVAEALADGIVLHLLSTDILNNSGHMWHGRMINLTQKEKERLKKFIRSRIGTKYSIIGAIAAGTHSKTLEQLRKENTLFCSEFAIEALQACLNPPREHACDHPSEKIIRSFTPKFTVPGDLYRKSKLWKIR